MIASNTRIKNLARKIKEKSITIRGVDIETLNNEYQCFRVRTHEPEYFFDMHVPKGRGWIKRKPYHRARKEIKWMIASAIYYNLKEGYKHPDGPLYLKGLRGEHKKINMKKIIFANHYGKYIYKNPQFYECYVKTEF